jgi:hypothetical protein
MRWFGFVAHPAHGTRFQGIDRLDPDFGVGAFWAFVAAVF